MKKNYLIIGFLVLTLVLTGFVVYKTLQNKPAPVVETEDVEPTPEILPTADEAISVEAKRSKVKDNTVIVSVSGLGNKITSVEYELTYESQELIKGVNSGSKPIDVAGKDTFDREVYLGTCSRNVCKPDVGVKKVSVDLKFTDSSGKKSQLSREFEI